MFLLSANEIVLSLDRTDENLPRFIVGTKALDTKYRVTIRRQALDKMAHEISIRSSLDSFRFLDQVNIPFRRVSEADIDYIYTLPVPNTQVDIPTAYQENRNRLRSLLYEMEEALVAIDIAKKAKPLEGIAKDCQSLWVSLDYDPVTLEFRGMDVRLLDNGAQEPPAALAKRSHLVEPGRRYKISIPREANNLWHGLMSDVLEAVCPEISDQED